MSPLLDNFNRTFDMKLLLGADPEVFVKEGNSFVSAFGMIPGTKDAPHPVERGAVQVDGMALEFNIDPSPDEESFVINIQHVMRQLELMVQGRQICVDSVAEFTEEYLKTQPDEAKVLGCDADYNAWTGTENPRPDQAELFRTAAGHVHFGWTDTDPGDPHHIDMCRDLVKQADFYLGLPSLVFDKDTKRREMYGKAGAFRPKPYGAEYRVLSNKWLSSEGLMRWVYKASHACFESMFGEHLVEKYGDIQEIINTSNVEAALNIISAENIPMPEAV